MYRLRQVVASATLCLFAVSAFGQESEQVLRIIALEGNNAVNYIPIKTATAPIVEVRDVNDQPVEGASVVFKAPATGPGARFEGGQTTLTAITDFRGQAGATGYTTNNLAGKFTIEVTASHRGRSARLVLTQINSMEAIPAAAAGIQRKSGGRKWLWIGLVAGAGAGAGLYFGLRGSSPILVGSGPVTVGGPR